MQTPNPGPSGGGSGADDEVLSSVYRKIERERALITAARSMRQSTDNASVQQRLDSSIRESQNNINYLEGVIRNLQNKRMQNLSSGVDAMGITSGPPYSESPPTPPPKHPNDAAAQEVDSGYTSVPGGGPRPPFAQQPGPGVPKSRPNYSKLDLIKYDSPYIGPRITLMLSQLEFKLSVEKQYKEGIEKMAKLYQMEGDRRSRADADSKRVESNQKIHLLKQALKRYEDLHVDIEGDAQGDDDSINAPNIRRPLTGRLHIKILAVKDVDHAATSRFGRAPETFVTVKVEDVRAKTKPSRNDRWADETNEIDVDKANEIEITVYDRSGDHSLPIGMMWIRLSDIVEELRRKRVEQDISATGWVSADNMEASNQATSPGAAGMTPSSRTQGALPPPPVNTGMPPASTSGGMGQGGEEPKPVFIDAWFVLEPVGQIHLQLSFVKYNKNKRPFDVGLNRKGAVRKQKEEIHETYGHKFVQQQFYNIMRCALCGDFLKYSVGYQCADCKYTCHKKCYPKVVTKCISKSNAETDPEEEKLNHRIPHRFEPTTNFGANWCCHCGYMLPVGKRNARKCSECQLTCHAQCAHLVPDFCGMSMEVANRILSEIGKTKRNGVPSTSMADRTLRGSQNLSMTTRPTSLQSTTGESLIDSQISDQRTPSLATQPTQSPVSSISTPSTMYDPSNPQAFDGKGAYNAAAKAYGPYSPVPPPPPPPQNQPRPQATPRSPSNSFAAAAAITALSGSRPGSGGRADTGYRPPAQQPPYNPAMMPNTGTMYQQQQAVTINSPVNTDPQQRISMGYVVPPPPPPPPPPQVNQSSSMQGQIQMQQYAPPGIPGPPKPTPYAAAPVPTSPPPPPTQVSKPPRSESARKIGLDHFNFLAVLGKGNFGKVMLAETKATKQLYAIKVLKKEFIIENDEVESIRSEKRVFLIANKERHPFLLNLHACFQTETRVYFVMEYISGGDLMLHIQRGQFGTKRAQFYAAEVCLALKYFHENGVIYRDLKLDNILLTLDGHIKIGDYGLCKEEMWYGSTTSTFCGTPEFMAPEILLDKRYGRAVDWWAFGVLIYQMLLQQSPFRGEDEDEIYDAILSDEPLYPIHMPRDSVSILQKLLTREPELRLGSGPTDAQEIMSHAFFRNVNWDDIYHKRVPSPFLPQISSPTDTSNFDQEFTSVTPVLTPVQSVLTQAMQEEFRGFSYTADFV
ncbi:Serine/threonine kinase [Orbilia brochopaga]|uniref:protein kinase C n=1 Tax=Orbilia brochopaga TaxID=3140254 RepID=A0AAV9TYY2_9PEZI